MKSKVKVFLGLFFSKEDNGDLVYVELYNNKAHLYLNPYGEREEYKVINSIDFHYTSFLDIFDEPDFIYSYNERKKPLFPPTL